jgi:hypothetical protein
MGGASGSNCDACPVATPLCKRLEQESTCVECLLSSDCPKSAPLCGQVDNRCKPSELADGAACGAREEILLHRVRQLVEVNQCSSFDYDCDGVPKKDPVHDHIVGAQNCDTANKVCSASPGFDGAVGCGATGKWISGCFVAGFMSAVFCQYNAGQNQAVRCR